MSSGDSTTVLCAVFVLLAAPPPTVVIEHDGTAWWVPFATALLVAVAAAAASYYVTWRFKKADVNRESAVRVADLVDEAEQKSSLHEGRDAAALAQIMRLLQQARVRAQPLGDSDLNDRLQAAGQHAFELRQQREPTSVDWHWLNEAVANAREGVVPHLSAPRLVGRAKAGERFFPTSADYLAMCTNAREDNSVTDQLVGWRASRPN